MKKSKLLTLAATAFMVFSAVGCQKTSNKGPKMTDDEVMSVAASTLWEMYKKDNNTFILGNYNVVKQLTVAGTYTVNVTWELGNVTGTKAGVKLTEPYAVEDAEKPLYQGIYIGYTDYVIAEETTFELVPSLTYNNSTKRMGELLEKKSDGSEKVFSRKTKPFEVNSFEDYIKIADAAGGSEKDTCVATICAYVTGISNSGKYVYLKDDKHGYMIYGADYNKQTAFKVGDVVIASGRVYAYSGCYEMVKATIQKIDNTNRFYPTYAMPTAYVDATEAFCNPNSKDANGKDVKNGNVIPYQFMNVELKNVTLTSVDGANYYFETENGKKYNLYWSTSYFLKEDENNQWSGKFYTGLKANVKGMVNVYSGNYQIYPTEVDCIEYVDTEANYAAYVASNTKVEGLKGFYGANAEVTLPTSGLFNSTITWAMKEGSSDKIVVDGGKLKVTPIAESVSSGTLVATIKVGETEVTKEYGIKTQILTDEQAADKVLEAVTNQDAYAMVTLPKTHAELGGEITYALKEAKEGYSVKDNVVVVPQVAADSTETVTVVATAKIGSATKTKEIVVTPKHTSTVNELLTSKDTTNEVYVRAIVTSFGGKSGTQSFTFADSTAAMFSYNKISMDSFKVGDEIVFKTKYAENSGFPQSGTVVDSVVKISEGNELPAPSALSVTATDLVAAVDAATDNAELISAYANKTVTITGGFATKNGTHYGIGTSADATSYKINTYGAFDLSKYEGKEIKVVGVLRGASKGKNVTVQIISVEEVK